MKQKHAHTLKALFHHPLQHDLRMSDIEALLLQLEASVEHLSDHRLKLQLPSGEIMVLHTAPGLKHSFLNEEGVLRLRRFLERAGITPEHPITPQQHPRGEQAKRLVIHLDHRGARLWWLQGDDVEKATLQPHGLWNDHQRLSHRHERDIAGQRAPLDYDYLDQLSTAVLKADRVVLLGHGHGQSDIRQLLRQYISRHHPVAEERMEQLIVDDTALSEEELLAVARKHFGNQAHRRLAQVAEKEIEETRKKEEKHKKATAADQMQSKPSQKNEKE